MQIVELTQTKRREKLSMLSLCYIIFKSRKDILEGNSDFSEKIQPEVLHENLLKIHMNDP